MATNESPPCPASYEHLFDRRQYSETALRYGILAAITIHLAVFAITWPTLVQTKVVAPKRVIVRRFPVVKYREPPPPDQRFKVPPRRVFVPDPDPQGPELIVSTQPEIIPIDFPEQVIPDFPEPPPVEQESHGENTVTAGKEIAAPKVQYRVEPRYTEAAKRIRFEGAVVLSLLIDTGGGIADLTVLQPLPFGLTESAVEAVRQWRFAPSTLNGDPVSVHYTLTVRFRLSS
jgi:TonB family protein